LLVCGFLRGCGPIKNPTKPRLYFLTPNSRKCTLLLETGIRYIIQSD
jgi:hypothetical protein